MLLHKKLIVLSIFLIGIIFSFIYLSAIPSLDVSYIELCDRNGVLLRKLVSSEYGTSCPVKLESLPVHLIDIVITTEDKRFFKHMGVDPIAITRAVRDNIESKKIVSGGSTITQQLIRNIYHKKRNIYIKIYESIRAVCADLRYSKRQILEHYLNRIPYGNGAYGIEAASRLYFAKSSSEITIAESAFLTAIPSSTKTYDPYRNFESTEKRQKKILIKVFKAGKISKQDFYMAYNEKIELFPKERNFFAPHFCDYVLSKYKNLLKGRVCTTLDYIIQKEVEYIVRNNLEQLNRANVTNASVVVLDNRTGDILAMLGSADYFNEENSGQVNGAISLRQPGSTVKPFVYGLALESGMTASDTLEDIETHIKLVSGDNFIPKNYDKKYHGMVRLRTALACSYNIATVNLTQRIGPDAILNKLHSAGFDSLKKDAKYYGPGISLGSGEVTLFELTRAFSGLANMGQIKETRVLLDEPVVYMGEILMPEAAYLVTDILSDNSAREPAFGEFSPLRLPFKCAAKTGTSKNFRDNWAVGYTPRYTVGVWVGNFSGSAMYSVSGISGAAPVFRDIMLMLERDNVNMEFKEPKKIVKNTICTKSGKLPNKYCSELIEEKYIKGNEVKEGCKLHKMYRIDIRNGYIAAKTCPKEFVKEKVFEVYPLEYYNWCSEAGIEFPPAKISEINKSGGMSEYLLDIEFPKDKDVFKIDPILRKEYQSITLKPKIARRIDRLEWHIDNQLKSVEDYPFYYTWQLIKGEHAIYSIAFDNQTGNNYKSSTINITVLE